MKTFNLTDPGEGLTEAEIVRWLVGVGDEVKICHILVQVETSKSLVELPIPWAGTVDAILVDVGTTVDVGTPIIRINDGSDEPEESGRTPNLVGYGPTEGATKRRARRGVAGPEAGAAEARQGVGESFEVTGPIGRRADQWEPLRPVPDRGPGVPLPAPGQPTPQTHPSQVAANKVLAKPPLRKFAKDNNVDLREVTGTGTGGVITRADVEAHLAARAAAVPTASGLVDRREPIRGIRKATAAAMVTSAFTSPQASEWVTVDVSRSMELIDRVRASREFRDVKVSPMLLVAKAVVLALGRTQELNSTWDEAAQEIIYHGTVNLGIACATPRGLVVPNVKGADGLGLLELAQTMNAMVQVAKEGRVQPRDLTGGTFTITNVGPFGVDGGTPILNPGEAAILALGQIARRPWVVGEGADERVEPRWVTTLAVTFDHRLVDGEQGSIFLADVARILSDPGQALLF